MSNQNYNNHFRLPMPEDLKKLRKKKGYTQAELAEHSGFSQSLIARIEGGNVNPRISTVRKIISVLSIHSDKAIDISTRDAITISQDSSVDNAIELMEKNSISQIPVSDPNTQKLVGIISEKLIMSYITEQGQNGVNDEIAKIQLENLKIISPDVQLSEIELILQSLPAILVKKDKDRFGIITKSDLLRYYKKL